MRLLLRFCASCAFLRPSLLVLFAAFAGHLAAQPANVQADPTTGALFRPAAATFISGNSLLTTSAAAAAYQPLDADLTSWAAVVRAGGFDTFVATPSSANLATLVTGETGTGALVFGTSPTFTTPTLGAATATSITGATDLTLAGGSTGASLVLGAASADSTALTANVNLYLQKAAGSSVVFRNNAAGSFTEAMRIAGTTGNLLIGTTTDAASLAGGLVVNGSGAGAASSGTNTGALRVTGGVGVSGAGYFGGSINAVGGQVTGTFTVGNGTANATNAINRGTTAQGNYVQWQTAGALNWAAGSGATGTNTNWELYNYGIGANALSISNTTSAAAFAGTVSAQGTGTHTFGTTNTVGLAAGSINGTNTTAGATTSLLIRNTDNTNSASSAVMQATVGGANAGDPRILLTVDAVVDWSLGVDNSDSDSLKIGPSGTVGTSTALTLTTAGAATFAGAVTIAGTVIHTLSATPASASAAGTVGTMSWDANYIYICTSANTWKRVAIATW
jgi:hypothetical protein